MKVLLTQDVKGIGRAGDLVNVADGYGRNYLIPRGLAIQAVGGAAKGIEHQQELLRRKLEREQSEARALAEKLEGATIRVTAKAGESGRLFGSVTAADVAAALAAQFGARLDRRKIEMEGPVKQLGSFPVVLRLSSGVTAQLTLLVEAEGATVEGTAS